MVAQVNFFSNDLICVSVLSFIFTVCCCDLLQFLCISSKKLMGQGYLLILHNLYFIAISV